VRGGWLAAARIYLDRRVLVILFLGFSSGLPLLLVFSTLSVWLKLEGVSLAAIGAFSLVRTPYTFKFLWAPLIDRVPVPLLGGLLGRRRAWALVTQGALMAAIFGMATTSPTETPGLTALFAVLVAFCSASQDIVIDAYRVEALADDEQGAGAGAIVLGYRFGMLAAGAGALWLAAVLTWNEVYAVIEAEKAAVLIAGGTVPWLARVAASLYAAVVAPFRDYMTRPGWLAALLFIMLYKLGEAYLGVMANPFYIEMGFTTVEIADVSKVFGLGATIVGGLLGGILVSRYGVMASLMICGILQIPGTLMFVIQALVGHSLPMLMVTIVAENVTAGMATSAFVAYLSSLCNQSYTATQYALLSSFMAFARDVLSASAGWTAEMMGWVSFFSFSAVLAVPALLLLAWMMRRYDGAVPVEAPGGSSP
jgi:PAT family beta-lactamase induction signal transducer AmpG